MFLILFGRTSQFFLVFVTVRLATTLLSPSEMGKNALIMSISTGVVLIFINPVVMFVNRRLHAWEASGKLQEYLFLLWIYMLCIALTAGIALYVLSLFGVLEFGVDITWLIILIGGTVLFNTMNHTYIFSLNMLGFPGWFTILTIATQVSGICFALFLSLYVEQAAVYWILGMLLGQIIVAALSKIVFDKKTKKQNQPNEVVKGPNKLYYRYLFRYAWPLSLAIGFGWVQSQGYRFILERMSGLEVLGLFVAGYSISVGVVTAFESVLGTYFLPGFYKKIHSTNLAERIEAWNTYVSVLFPALVVTVLFTAGLSTELTRILLGPAFQNASYIVIWGSVIEFMRVMVSAYSLLAHSELKTQVLLVPNMIAAALTLGLGVLFISKLHGTGAALSMVVSGFILVILLRKNMQNWTGIRLPIKKMAGSLMMGLTFFLIPFLIEKMFIINNSIVKALIILVFAGVIYMVMQYIIVAPSLRSKSIRI